MIELTSFYLRCRCQGKHCGHHNASELCPNELAETTTVRIGLGEGLCQECWETLLAEFEEKSG